MTKKIKVKKIHTDEYMTKKEGKFFTDDDMKIYNENVDVYTEDGKLLLKFRKNVISDDDVNILYDIKNVATLGATRPSASGIPKSGKYKIIKSNHVI